MLTRRNKCSLLEMALHVEKKKNVIFRFSRISNIFVPPIYQPEAITCSSVCGLLEVPS